MIVSVLQFEELLLLESRREENIATKLRYLLNMAAIATVCRRSETPPRRRGFVVRRMQALKYCPIMKSFALLLLLCQLAFSADPPKFGWKKLGEETFSLNATAHKDFRLPKGRLLFQFKAEEAIYAGVATAEQYAPFKAGKYLELANFKSFHCVKTDLIEGMQQCNVTVPNAVLAIRDKRGPGTQVLGAYSVLHPLDRGTMADRATKPNKVRVTLYAWACIENCIASNP